MKELVLIKTHAHGYVAVLGEKYNEAPDPGWIAMQSIPPSTEGDWYSAYPVDGGAIGTNENDFDILGVITKDEWDVIQDRNSFNPANDTVQEMFAE